MPVKIMKANFCYVNPQNMIKGCTVFGSYRWAIHLENNINPIFNRITGIDRRYDINSNGQALFCNESHRRLISLRDIGKSLDDKAFI